MIESFQSNGYLHVPHVIPEHLIESFKSLANVLEAKALEAHKQGDQLIGACVIEDKVGPRIMRCNDLYLHEFNLLNQLIASPKLLKKIKELCGPKAIVIQSDLLFKQQHPHPVIKWHQDAPTEDSSHFLNIGIYLDSADKDDGCLRYLPGTQHELQDIASIEKMFGWNPPGVVQVPAEPGDIIIQDMMVLHASEPKRSEGARRTVYIEVRSYEALVEEGIYNRDWIDLRKCWMGEILKYDEEDIYTDEEKAFFQNDHQPQEEVLIKKLHEVTSPSIPAAYGIFNVEGPNYPIPDNLKEKATS